MDKVTMEWIKWVKNESDPDHKKDILYYGEGRYAGCEGNQFGHSWDFIPSHYTYIKPPTNN